MAAIPLIRSGAIAPFVHWMLANGRSAEDRLREVDLPYYSVKDPDRPIPLGPAIAFACAASRAESPDLACRVVSKSSVPELGMIGRVALGTGSVGDSLARVAAAMPQHVTHELITVSATPEGVIVREAWVMRLDGETRHILQQYVAALIQALCDYSGAAQPMFGRVRLVPHPVHGLSHLRRWYGQRIEGSSDGALELFIPSRIANLPLRVDTPALQSSDHNGDHAPLRGDGSLGASADLVLRAMLSDGVPTVERLARAAGMSVRTLQRRLGEEGTTFSKLLNSLRHDLAVAGLADGDQPVGKIAAALGYNQQSSLTRAVRRWAGRPPRSLARPDKS